MSAESPAVTMTSVMDAIRPVQDPEMRLGIVDLGLVYDVVVAESGEDVTVKMTLTSPMCPVGPMIMEAVHESVARMPGVRQDYASSLCPVAEFLQARMVQLKTNYYDPTQIEGQVSALRQALGHLTV